MKIAVILLPMLLAIAASVSAQSTPAPETTPPAASPASTPPSAVIPAATLPNPHRLVRDLKANADNIQSQGNFGAQLWLIANEHFFQDWRKPDSPSLDPVEAAIRGQPIFTVVVFYGLARDEKGQANVTYDLVVRRPDGSVYSERKDLVGYQAAAPADERMLALGRNYLNINIGPEDPAGKYVVEGTVRDTVAKVSVVLKKEFVVP